MFIVVISVVSSFSMFLINVIIFVISWILFIFMDSMASTISSSNSFTCIFSFVSLNPTFNQIEKMAEALRRHGFIRVESVELLERPLLAREGKTRPVQRMIGHTEFLVFGVRVLDPA